MSKSFSIARRVQFAEVDAAGVLHFSNYYRLMEEVEHAFWRSLGESVVAERGTDGRWLSWPRVTTSCEYLAPARFEDVIDLTLRVDAVGRRSLTLAIEFAVEGKPIARGRVKAVACLIAHGTFEAVDVPPRLRDKLQPYLDTGETAQAGP